MGADLKHYLEGPKLNQHRFRDSTIYTDVRRTMRGTIVW